MAEVYAARTQGISGFEKKVAIKKILPQYSLNPRFVDMLVDEAKITVSLTHPNIAQVYELGLEGETYYIVMEYVDGRPLNKLMQRLDQRGQMHVPFVHGVHIVAEVAKGLHHAHNSKDPRGNPLSIVHRDISPQNILIGHAGDVKLIDFGIARAAGRAAQTRAGVIKGKLRYLAPEIALGEDPDSRSDVYCCGIVLFELLTGEALYAPRTDIEAIEMASEARVRTPKSSNPEVPPELDDICMKALTKEREHRYQTAKHLYTDLRRFLNQKHPAYVGSELGDVMQELFITEIEEDRRLDQIAELVAREADSDDLPTQGIDHRKALGYRKGSEGSYQQIVTRAEIEVPPKRDELDDSQSAPRRDASHARPDEVTRDSAPIEPAALVPPTPDSVETKRPPPRARASTKPIAILLVIGAAVALGVSLASGPDEQAPIPPLAPLAAVDPEPPATPTTGSLLVRVSPSERIDVRIGGELRAQAALPPVTISDVPAGRAVKIEVIAAGYETAELARTVPSGGQSLVDLDLKLLTGTIQLDGLGSGRVEVDPGRVDGDKLVDLPLKTPIKVKVTRPGAKEFVQKVTLESPEPLVLAVPSAVPLAKGKLIVTSSPDCIVFINGRREGETPLTKTLPPGSYKVMWKTAGGDTRTQDVTVRSNEAARVSMRWGR
ncbi:MAG: protein kinase [Deltaproteobacteria bacterium]|nr:protein kinase [Deltaproteobacteria bacterium]